MSSDSDSEDLTNEALSNAATSGDLALVQTIVEQWKAQLHPSPLTPKHLQSAMAAAASSHHPTIVSYLLDQGAKVSPYNIVVALGDTEATIAMFQTFLDHGWDINSKTSLGIPVLKHVIANEPLTRFFLSHNADPNLTTNPGGTLLDVAAANSTPAIFSLLLAHGANLSTSDALHSAAGELSKIPGRVEMMEYLLDLGLDVNALWRREYPPSRRKGRGTPLHAAVSSQERDRIVFLLERGADARIKDTLERTPMEYAVEKGLEGAVGVLREYEDMGQAA